jgi:hypothetical protein
MGHDSSALTGRFRSGSRAKRSAGRRCPPPNRSGSAPARAVAQRGLGWAGCRSGWQTGGVAYVDPEAASRGDIPARFARALAGAVSPQREYAVVLLGTNEPPSLYPYEVVCERTQDGWEELVGRNGPGRTGVSGDVRIESYSGEAPQGSSEVVVEHAGQRHSVPVRNGYYLFVAWSVTAGVSWDDGAQPDGDLRQW